MAIDATAAAACVEEIAEAAKAAGEITALAVAAVVAAPEAIHGELTGAVTAAAAVIMATCTCTNPSQAAATAVMAPLTLAVMCNTAAATRLQLRAEM